VDLDPENASYVITTGAALHRVGRHDLALDMFSRASALDGTDDPEVLAFIAMTRFRLGNLDSARRIIEGLAAADDAPPVDEARAIIGARAP
jgi:Flp pilus assembly protein TadD